MYQSSKESSPQEPEENVKGKSDAKHKISDSDIQDAEEVEEEPAED